ncbi:MAG: rhodanese-like domain-containing protein, partial [Planctomycetales bacterium]|nr:rhodanese-like domain-containing protein [Planctomycetales bacterium]
MSKTISPAALKDQLNSPGARLIDVRTPVEFQSLHVRGAESVPLDKLDPAAFKDCQGPLYVICQRGN